MSALLRDHQRRAWKRELAAYFVHYIDLTDIATWREVLERHLEFHRDRLRPAVGQRRRVQRTYLEPLMALLVEQAHADLHAARLRVRGVRPGIVDIDGNVQGLPSAEDLRNV